MDDDRAAGGAPEPGPDATAVGSVALDAKPQQSVTAESAETSADDSGFTRPALVVFTPSGRRGSIPIGTTVLQAARTLGVDLDSVCGGRGLCGRCQIRVASGRHARHRIESDASHLGESTRVEARYARIHGDLAEGRRLGCQARIEGDLVIDVPAESQVHRQVVRKNAEHVLLRLDPAVRLHHVHVREPDMHEPSSDLRRLKEALLNEWQLDDLTCDLPVLQTLQKSLRAGEWKVTVAVAQGRRIVALWPGFRERVYGAAIDIGSTTIACHLCDLSTGDVVASSGAMNPQIRFGEDLMSRVSWVMMNPGGDRELTDAVRAALDALLGEVADEAGISREEILELVLVGNPVMHHLLLGIDPTELGGAPFALCADESIALSARALDLHVHPQADAMFLPCVAGHVGADTAAMVLAEQPNGLEEWTLLVDVGTNAEIVLGNHWRMLACSSPTGPAFEGAQISGGQRAAPGAIERVRIDPDTLEPRYRVIGSELWSDEPGFAESIASTGVTGICGSGIIEVVAEMFLAGILQADGTLRGELAERSTRVVADDRTFAYRLHDGDPAIRITQNDVRQIQLAKAALYAGVRLLMNRLGIDRVDRIRLAGAFGSHIDVKYAMVLGLIPDCALDQVGSAGNAAGIGARIALLDQASRTAIDDTVRRIEKIETAVEADFQRHFVDAMAFPHRVDTFPHLSQAVKLPARETQDERPTGGRRRRRRGAAR